MQFEYIHIEIICIYSYIGYLSASSPAEWHVNFQGIKHMYVQLPQMTALQSSVKPRENLVDDDFNCLNQSTEKEQEVS